MSRRRARGFTMFEVLAALSLFAVVGSAVAVLATRSVLSTTRNKHATAATLIAQRTVERLRALPYADVASGSTTVSYGHTAYTVDTAVLSDTPAAGMKRISVRVNWISPGGPRTYAVETIFTAVTS